MKISVLIPSRGKDSSRVAVIGALHGLSSGNNEIRYCLGLDMDDEYASYYPYPESWNVAVYKKDRFASLGARYNDLATDNPADLYVLFADDIFPMTLNWDMAICQCFEKIPDNILAWFDVAQPMLPTYPIIPHKWLTLSGRIFTDHFPFWFDDTWFSEVYKMATGQDILIPQQLIFAGRKSKTKRMRDLAFWWDFFSRTRPLRVKEAAEIRTKAGATGDNAEFVTQVTEEGKKRDAFFIERIPQMEAASSEIEEPSEAYLKVKSLAEKLLVDLRL